jgi:phage repressor protein C with HTH and peptisase S24 domain
MEPLINTARTDTADLGGVSHSADLVDCKAQGAHKPEPLGYVLSVHNRRELKVQSSSTIIEPMVHTDDSRDAFSDRLREALKHARKSGRGEGAWLSKTAGVTPKAASKWLNGEARPSHEKVVKVANALRVREDWLLYGRGPRMDEYPSMTEPTNMEITETPGPLYHDEIELPYFREVEMQGGLGRTEVIENHGVSMRFPIAKLARAGVQPENAACATLVGNSMETTIMDGSPIAIDRGCTQIVDGKIYAIDHGGMFRVKRLYRLPMNRIRIVSDNSDEHPDEIVSPPDLQDLRIIGRVFWWESFDK